MDCAGEIALPGGKTEQGDADDVQTALREAHEEIGLDPELVHVVAVLDPSTTRVLFLMFFRCVWEGRGVEGKFSYMLMCSL